jgi:ABC-2 type transport system permease protein
MSRATRIARDEWRHMMRSRVAVVAMAMLVLLSIVAAATSIAHRQSGEALRQRFQAQANTEFEGQPARHPHRMVHYGHFVFRPMPVLAAFDTGVDAFTGTTIFLEGHRQNSANFGDVRQSSLLIRFGQLTPAFVLQTLAPLVLIFIGFGIVARERERGTLRLLYAHGASPASVLAGKTLALAGAASILALPALATLAWLVVAHGAPAGEATMLALGYGGYLALWVGLIAVGSALAGQARIALIGLVALWALCVVLLPRVAPDIALGLTPGASRIETDVAIQRDLRRIGDSHNPDDPHFAAFKQGVLDRYGVESVEQLPVNYRGLLALEGERLTSQLFDRYADDQFAAQRRQSGIVGWFGLASPAIALRSMSMALAGTGLENHRRFLAQAEDYRYAIVQQLNRLQATALTYSDDGARNSDPDAARRVRIGPDNWQAVPDFAYRGTTTPERLAAAWPGLVVIAAWLVAVALAAAMALRRMREAA